MYCDNKATIAMTQNPIFPGRMKHIEIHQHFIGEHVARGEINTEYYNTEDQIADIFTKVLPRNRFYKLHDMLGVVCI